MGGEKTLLVSYTCMTSAGQPEQQGFRAGIQEMCKTGNVAQATYLGPSAVEFDRQTSRLQYGQDGGFPVIIKGTPKGVLHIHENHHCRQDASEDMPWHLSTACAKSAQAKAAEDRLQQPVRPSAL